MLSFPSKGWFLFSPASRFCFAYWSVSISCISLESNDNCFVKCLCDKTWHTSEYADSKSPAFIFSSHFGSKGKKANCLRLRAAHFLSLGKFLWNSKAQVQDRCARLWTGGSPVGHKRLYGFKCKTGNLMRMANVKQIAACIELAFSIQDRETCGGGGSAEKKQVALQVQKCWGVACKLGKIIQRSHWN